MEIQEVVDRREKLELQLLHLLNTFQEETGVSITQINLERVRFVGQRHGALECVEVKIEI